MPIYEYRCESCGVQEEKLESLTAPVEHDCTACHTALGMKRQLSVASFAFTGGGWYASDYARKGDTVGEPSTAPKAGGCCGGNCACPAKQP